MNIYFKSGLKNTFKVIGIIFLIVIVLCALMFITDYIMFRSNLPIIFAKSVVTLDDNTHTTKEQGLFYYVENDGLVQHMYLFGKKIR